MVKPWLALGKLLFATPKSEDCRFPLGVTDGNYVVCGIFKRNLAVEPETLELNTGHVSH